MGEKVFRNNRKQNNKGFSLLELLVVVAIIGIVSGLVLIGISVIASADSKKMSKALYSDINTLKTKTLTVSGDWYLIVKKEDKVYKYQLYKETPEYNADGTLLTTHTTLMEESKGGRRVSLAFYSKYNADGNRDESSKYAIDENQYMKISFKNDTGAFNRVEIYHVGSDTPKYSTTKDDYRGCIVLSSATHSGVYEINMWYKTGRVTTVN